MLLKKQTNRKQFCALSSSKTNIGHLYECAGIAAFIKAVAALTHQKIPGMCHFTVPNKKIDFCDSPVLYHILFRGNGLPENNHVRTCGISAFGMSGTNCHVVLQEYRAETPELQERESDMLCLSAKSLESLRRLVAQYAALIRDSNKTVEIAGLLISIALSSWGVSLVFPGRRTFAQKLEALEDYGLFRLAHHSGCLLPS